MRGGDDWDPRDRTQAAHLRHLHPARLASFDRRSDYVVDREIAIVRERQAKGETSVLPAVADADAEDAGLNLVRDTNLRPREAKPFSDYSINDRYRHMADAADEVADIAEEFGNTKARSAFASAGAGAAGSFPAFAPASLRESQGPPITDKPVRSRIGSSGQSPDAAAVIAGCARRCALCPLWSMQRRIRAGAVFRRSAPWHGPQGDIRPTRNELRATADWPLGRSCR